MILMYHNVLPINAPKGYEYQSISLSEDSFRRQMKFISRIFNPVSLDHYLNGRKSKRDVVITFDDGTAETYRTVLPVIETLNIPITIFVATQQIEDGPLIWAAYINALCFENIYESLEMEGTELPLSTSEERVRAKNHLVQMAINSADQRVFVDKLRIKFPIPAKIDYYYRGMSHEQLKHAGMHPQITIGAHSISHPELTRLNYEEQKSEIKGSIDTLKAYCETEITTFAYPSGDYNRITLEILEELGIEHSFAVASKGLGTAKYEIERIGVFSPSILKLGLKLLKGMV